MNTPSTTQRTTILLDASALKESSCILRFYRKIIQGYTCSVNSADIEFGSAFHLYRKLYTEADGDEMAQLLAIKEAQKYFKEVPKFTKERKQYLDDAYLYKTCQNYDTCYPPLQDEYKVARSANGKPMVELRISYPYYITPEGDIEVLLCGTLDELALNTIANFYVIKDYKTTSLWNSAQYFSAYELSTQLMFYKLLLSKFATLYPDSSISKIYNSGNIGAMIDGVFLKPANPEFKRSNVFWFSDKRMAEFETLVRDKMHMLIDAVRNPELLLREGMINGSCERVFGPCDFFQACCTDDVEIRQEILQNDFVKRVYQPMLHGTIRK